MRDLSKVELSGLKEKRERVHLTDWVDRKVENKVERV